MAIAYFRMEDGDKRPFVIRLEDDGLIAHARQLMAGTTTSRPHVQGIIVSKPAEYNPGWSYHLDPSTIGFFDIATEVCDAASLYVEQNLSDVGGAFLPNAHWCPWESYLTSELVVAAVMVAAPAASAPKVPLKDAFDIYQKQSDAVHKLWGYLSVVSIAVLGFTIGSDKINWSSPAYLFMGSAYLLFAGSNLWVLRRSQQELVRIGEGLRLSAEQTGDEASSFVVKPVAALPVTLFHAASICIVLGAMAVTWYQNCAHGTKCGNAIPAAISAPCVTCSPAASKPSP